MPNSCRTHRQSRWGTLPIRRDNRLSASKRGYGRVWQRLRLMVLHRDPFCRDYFGIGCHDPSTQVDHIIPRSRGGDDTMENLQGLCAACHSRKTVAEDGGFRR